MQTNLIRGLATFLRVLAVGAAGILGCADRPAGSGATAPPAAMEQQGGPQVDDEADAQAGRERAEQDLGSSPKLPPGVPVNVGRVLKYIDEHKRAPEGYEGGRTFGNFNGLLPERDAKGLRIHYQEWDVNRKVRGKNRGRERLVTGSDGSAYYSPDHYNSFLKIR